MEISPKTREFIINKLTEIEMYVNTHFLNEKLDKIILYRIEEYLRKQFNHELILSNNENFFRFDTYIDTDEGIFPVSIDIM